MHAVETLFSVPPVRSVHALCRCNASRTELKHVVSHSSTNMLTEAQNGLPAGEVNWFERHALNIPAASQLQRPQSAARPHPLERHPPPPRSNLHLTPHAAVATGKSRTTVARRSAGEIDEDARSSGGRPSGPRVRPDAPVGRGRPHCGEQRQAGSCARSGRPLRGTTKLAPDIGGDT